MPACNANKIYDILEKHTKLNWDVGSTKIFDCLVWYKRIDQCHVF